MCWVLVFQAGAPAREAELQAVRQRYVLLQQTAAEWREALVRKHGDCEVWRRRAESRGLPIRREDAELQAEIRSVTSFSPGSWSKASGFKEVEKAPRIPPRFAGHADKSSHQLTWPDVSAIKTPTRMTWESPRGRSESGRMNSTLTQPGLTSQATRGSRGGLAFLTALHTRSPSPHPAGEAFPLFLLLLHYLVQGLCFLCAQLLVRVLLLWCVPVAALVGGIAPDTLGLVLSSAASVFDLYHWLTSGPKRRSSWRFFFLRWAILCILQIWSLLLHESIKPEPSVYESTPTDVLHEIVVVDDGSNPPLSTTHLNEEVRQKYKVLIKRHDQTVGLIGAKQTGGDAATGDIIVFFDCHVAPQPKWYVDFLTLIGENYRRMVIPQITGLDIDTWTQVGSGGGMSKCYLTWDGDFKWGGTDDMYMGMLSGGLAGMSRYWWDESGGFDSKMLGWGGENIDQGVRMWVCGGEIVAAPRSQVAHMWRTHSAKTSAHYKRVGDTMFNRARAIHAWLQEFSDKLYDYPSFANRKRSGGEDWIGDAWHEWMWTCMILELSQKELWNI
eukprot:s15_g46.t1